MNKACPLVASLAALLHLLQLRQSCRWSVQPGVELLALSGERGRELMLNLQPGCLPPGFYRQILSQRAQQLDSYDGYYLCLDGECRLSVWCRLPEENEDVMPNIGRLFSLAGMTSPTL
ncbi:HrpV family type III secretion system protein [Serratia marcescens]|uniref:HrpV family type III secretion system protein n=1 Tax=Serratia marcescens TaxID=615 RepID=UPI000D73DE9C|nr:HrpV family type III secretion system protein [Serratia marcescens]AWO77482.1 type III secretion system protein [Serratia marcescens]